MSASPTQCRRAVRAARPIPAAARTRAPGRVFVISSPSGGGKTTVVERLRRMMPQLSRSVSVTTRTPRSGERKGRDYRFVSRATFQRLQRSGQLLEWARVHGASYGTPRRRVLDTLRRGGSIVLSIDVQGARQIRRALGPQAALIFLLPPSMTHLRQRLAARNTETPMAIRRRLAAARREMACAAWYDYAVVNDRLDHTVRRVARIIRTAQRAPTRTIARRPKGEPQ
ncbi:MAG: guanylate kinase [Candidatus Omnitrophica bacterium]|nr:guanylate kinase [Candidatus Omnitrophota bacterium]